MASNFWQRALQPVVEQQRQPTPPATYRFQPQQRSSAPVAPPPAQMPQTEGEDGPTFSDALAHSAEWTGPGMRERNTHGDCPQCGSHLYYARSQASTRGMHPAPHCFSCGYNGMYEMGQPPT